jgi:hypothetical protein
MQYNIFFNWPKNHIQLFGTSDWNVTKLALKLVEANSLESAYAESSVATATFSSTGSENG